MLAVAAVGFILHMSTIQEVFPTKRAAVRVKSGGTRVWVMAGTEGYTEGMILQW